jgi:hypothetical protein
MSTITRHLTDHDVPGARPRGQLRRRALAVARMHLVDLRTLGLIPWSILASIFAINIAVWQFVPAESRNTGGASSIYCFLLAVAVLAVARSLPFALGMGTSRRAFVLGTMLTGLILSVGFGAILFALQLIERASGGWWMQGHFFWFPWFARSSHAAALLMLVTSLAASFVLGALVAACWVRWNVLTFVVGVPVLILLCGGLTILLAWQSWWDELGHWFAGQSPLSTAGWCALAAVVLGGLSHLVLRRVRA